MTEQSDLERLGKINNYYDSHGDFASEADIEVLFALARDGLRWRDCAAASGEVDVAARAYDAERCRLNEMWHGRSCPPMSEENLRNITPMIEAALKAAAAWHKAHEPKPAERLIVQAGTSLDVEALNTMVDKLEDLCCRLEDTDHPEISRLQRLIEVTEAERDALRAQVEMLRVVLEPFAREADLWQDFVPDTQPGACCDVRRVQIPYTHSGNTKLVAQCGHEAEFTIGDLRRARAALAATAPKEPSDD